MMKKVAGLIILLILVFLLISIAFTAEEEKYVFVKAWGGNGGVQFSAPSGITVDPKSGAIYVADYGNRRVQKFDSEGNPIPPNMWGSYGNGDSQFYDLDKIAVDSDGNVYVAAFGNNRIQKFDANGKSLFMWGKEGAEQGQFNYPRGIAVDPINKFVYVADSYNHRVQKFDLQGTFKAAWGILGNGPGKFRMPNGIAVDAAGNVFVADYQNNYIQKFDPNSYKCLAIWGSAGNKEGQFNAPSGVAVDSKGNVFVADHNNNRVQKFAFENGKYVFQVIIGNGKGTDPGQFNGPWDVAVDSNGNVYVTDLYNNRVQKFALKGATTTTTSTSTTTTIQPTTTTTTTTTTSSSTTTTTSPTTTTTVYQLKNQNQWENQVKPQEEEPQWNEPINPQDLKPDNLIEEEYIFPEETDQTSPAISQPGKKRIIKHKKIEVRKRFNE